VPKPTIRNLNPFIHITYPSPFELVGRDIQTKDNAQENAELVKARLKVRADSLLSDPFDHYIHDERLRTEEGIRRMFRGRAQAELALKPEFAAPGQSPISQERPPMRAKSLACALSCARRIDEVASDVQRQQRCAARAGSKPKGSATWLLPNDV
jgi:hypothetical protein